MSLNIGIFKPAAILFGIVLLPITIACFILYGIDLRTPALIVAIVAAAVYALLLFVMYRESRKKENCICVENDRIHIRYPNLLKNGEPLILAKDDIIKIEYYRITSVRGWCMLFNCVYPQCAYITYSHDGKELCRHIGYPRCDEISRLCESLGINLEVK